MIELSDKPWKAEERTVARMFGTSRALMKGTNEKSDIISDIFVVDVKLRKRVNVHKTYRDLLAAARKQDKIPILTMREPGAKLRLAVLDLDYLISILKGAQMNAERRPDKAAGKMVVSDTESPYKGRREYA